MADASLVSSWAVCGIAAAAARFVPVPLLDDVIRQRALQQAVVRTVRSHGRDASAPTWQPLWDEPRQAGGSRWRRTVGALGRRLLLFPVRKYTALFGAVRGVPHDVLRVVLVARTVDRLLAQDPTQFERDPARAAAVRAAVTDAQRGMDLGLLTAGLADGLSRTSGLSTAAVRLARRRFTGSDEGADPHADRPVAEGAASVQQVLDRPDAQVLLARFDVQVDDRLRVGP